jgi:hypothetical protein
MTGPEQHIAFISNLGDVGGRPSIGTVEGGLAVRAHAPLLLSNDEVRHAIKEAIKELEAFLGETTPDDKDSAFALDEVEFTLVVSQSGKVSVFLADVGGSIEGGLRLKWQRRKT